MIRQKVIHDYTFDFDDNNNNDIVNYSNFIIVDLLNAHCMSATMLRTVLESHMIPVVLCVKGSYYPHYTDKETEA